VSSFSLASSSSNDISWASISIVPSSMICQGKQFRVCHNQDAEVVMTYKEKTINIPFCMLLTSEDALECSCRWRHLSLGYHARFPICVPMKIRTGHRSNKLKLAQTVCSRTHKVCLVALAILSPLND
jgi:hypothetical protein